MKKINKMLVVLPLVLVFVLSSLPVFAWHGTEGDLEVSAITLEKQDKTTVSLPAVTIKITDFTDAYKDAAGQANADMVLERVLKGTAFETLLAEGKIEVVSGLDKIVEAVDGTTTMPASDPKVIKVAELKLKEKETKDPNPSEDPKPAEEDLITVAAVEEGTHKVIPTLMRYLKNKPGADSMRDRALEFYGYEQAAGTLTDYYMLGFAPDNNLERSAEEAAVMAELKVDLMIWVAKKLQPLSVTHVFPDRDPLYETIMVDYYAIHDNRINNYNAAEFAKSRIQKLNEMGYVFEKAEYVPFEKREGLLRIAKDAWGRKLPLNLVVKGNGIFIYYKGATIPAPVPVVDSQKKVDAASAQTAPQTVVNNVQANVQNPAAPVTAAGQQLPATGVADNAFLFLSSAALMALGIFFFKKH